MLYTEHVFIHASKGVASSMAVCGDADSVSCIEVCYTAFLGDMW